MAACIIVFSCAGFVSAQEVTVSLGSVTKYTGIVTEKSDVDDVKSINNFLNTLEAQVAKAFIEHPEVDYLDRMDTGALFRELHFSSDAAFNPNSGALRNLLGRLDFLVVMDASTTSSARIRLIDVETGAVKAIDTCTKHWSLSFGEPAAPDCIAPFVKQSVAAAKAKKQTKLDRQKLAAKAAADAKTMEQKREKTIAAAQLKATAEAKAEERAREEGEAAAQAKAAADAAAEAQREGEIDRQLADIKPMLDSLSSRLNSHVTFWRNMSLQLASTGQSLRSSVQSLLDNAKTENMDCHNFYGNRDVERLHGCIGNLQVDVQKLDALRD